MYPSDFSLLAPRREEEQTEMADEEKMLMQKAAGLAGGIRFGGKEGAIFHLLRMWWIVSEDDVALMMASAEIPGGVRYVPAGW